MKNKTNLLGILCSMVIFSVVIYFWSRPSSYDKETCRLKNMAIKSVVKRIVPGHEVTFTIDSINAYFPMSFTDKSDPRDEVKEIQPGEIDVTPVKGDSVFKAAQSDEILFKRNGKRFYKHLYTRGCD